jgi:hypothetical protein
MGKKYNTVTATIAPYAIGLEPLFEYTAYEGIKPSRAAAVVASNRAIALLEADALAERATNWKPKTDKVGRRPAVTECLQIPSLQTFTGEMTGGTQYPVTIDISQEWEVIGKIAYCWGTYVIEEGDQGQYLVHFSSQWGTRTYGFTEWRWLKQELRALEFAYKVEILKDLDLE